MFKVFKNFGFLSVISIFIMLCCASTAFAQVAGKDGTASAGTLMAAVMEQVGYHAQGQVLSDMHEYIEWGGALVYLGVVLSGVLTVALLGTYRAALWILVGPTMFFYFSGIEVSGYKNTIQGAGVEWRFGAFDDSKTGNEKQTLLAEPDVGTPSEVSFFFHKYNVMISEIYQELIRVITNRDTRAQMMFMSRQMVMEELFNEQFNMSGMQGLVRYFLVECNKEIANAAFVAQGMRNEDVKKDPYWDVAKTEYCEGWVEKKPFSPGAWQEWAFDAGEYKGTYISLSDNNGPSRAREEGVTTCADMWGWIMRGAQATVKAAAEEASVTSIHKAAWNESGDKTWNEVIEEIFCKLTNEGGDCKDNGGTPEEKKETETFQCENGAAAPESNLDKIEVLTRVIAGYVVKKELVSTPLSAALTRVTSSSDGFRPQATMPLGENPDESMKIVRRQAQHQYSSSRQIEAFFMINLLPYMQGFLLYVLSVTYPFFCIMLLIPGQAGSFLTWLALWAWVKSWDVGFAFVMIADEVLWELMPQTAFIDPNKGQNFINPVNVLEMVFDGDVSYNNSTYWLLLSGMISAVPIVSANVFLGAKKAVAGVMLKGFSEVADNFGAGAADYVAGNQVMAYARMRGLNGVEKLSAQATGASANRGSADQKMKEVNGNGPLDGAAGATGQNADRADAQLDSAHWNAEKKKTEAEIDALK